MHMLHVSEFRFTCPRCGTQNSVTAQEISDEFQVDCTVCHASVGASGYAGSRAEKLQARSRQIAH